MRLSLFGIFALLVGLRLPEVFLTPRLWAEEGLFFQNAWTMPASQALWREYGGYLNIIANAAGVIARHTVALRDAPLVATGIGLLFQTFPAVLIVTSRATWLQRPGAMALAVLAVAAMPATEEVWLQTLHSQNHLGLCVAFILSFDDAPGPAVRWFRRAILLLAPLSGLFAVLVLPLMLLRAAIERSRERTIQCCLLGAGALIQVGLFYTPESGVALGRSDRVWPGILAYSLFIRHVAEPLIGLWATQALGDAIALAMRAGRSPLWPVGLLALFAGVAIWASMRRSWTGAPWLLAAAGSIAVVSYAGAIHGGFILLFPLAGERYSFVPQVLLTCTLIAIGSPGRVDLLSRAATFVAMWMIMLGLLDYMRPMERFSSGPEWREEVSLWEADPDHVIRLWPEGWYMQLTRDHSPVWLKVRPPELNNKAPHDDRML